MKALELHQAPQMNPIMEEQSILDTLEIKGRLLRVAKMKNEGYDFIEEPDKVISALKNGRTKADVLTFFQQPHEVEPKYPFHRTNYSVAILPISTYENWRKKQINDKTRNMLRKASKSGIELRTATLDRDFINGVVSIYNESPVRQGKRFWHYGMDFARAKAHLDTFTQRSQFVGAYDGAEMIGFFKLTRNANSASVMQIISKISQRNKAPNNALLARAVEMCAEQGIPFLQYGIWSRGGLGDYKIKHGFLRYDIPRYYVPLNAAGRLAVQLRLYRNAGDFIPERLREWLLSLRDSWYAFRYNKRSSRPGQ